MLYAYASEVQANAEMSLDSITDALTAVAFFAAVTLILIYLIIRRHKERLELIRRGVNPNVQAPAFPGNRALFWGIVSASVGLGLLVYAVIDWEASDALGFGLALTFAGGGLLLYWRLTAAQRKEAREFQKELLARNPAP